MSENTEPAPGAGLAPAVRRHWRIPSSLGWIALLAVLGMKFVVCQSAEIDCATAVKESNDAIIVIACQKEYLNTGNPQAGGWLAEAQYRSNNPAVASAVADGLLVSSARGIALRVLGKIANAEGRYELAEANLRRAQAVHLAEGDYHDLARDDQALISIQGNQYHYADALRSVDDCVQHAHAAHETLIEAYCHEAAVYPLAQRGATEIAEHELQLAERLLDERPNHDRELAWFEYEYASALRESPPPPLQPKYYTAQIAAFRKALQLAERSQQLTLVVGIDLSLAYSLIHAGALTEAAHYLDEADINDHTDVKHNDRLRLRAELALSRGDLATTRKICDELYGNPDFDDTIDQIEITLIAARAALAGGDLVSAEAWARRGIAEAHKIPAEQRDAELRAWTLSNYHEPYEMLFSVLARAGKLDEAVQAFDQWQGHMMFDALIRPEPPASFDLRQLAARIDSMHQSSPSLARNPMLSTEPGDVQIAQIRATELVALLVANGDLWRIASGAGQLEIRDLGPLGSAAEPDHQVAADCSEDSTTRDLHQLIEHFAAAPTNPTCASKLGELVLPDAVAHATEVPLRVVLDAPLVDMPFAALRHAGTPLVKLRPIVRVPRLFEVGCVARARRPAPPVIVADADGNLPDARREAEAFARQLGAPAQLGRAATVSAVRAAGAGSLLFVATHAGIDEHGGYLALADGPLYALELSQRPAAPEIVILSSCVSALSNALGPAGSLAAAFLAAGSSQVVATLRRVSDPGSHELITAFFADGGTRDPVRALARVQARLADTPNTDWPSFAVFGQDFCPSSP